VFELQDKIAVSVVGVIEPALQAAAEMRRSAARPTIDLTAYALYLRALAAFYPITQERIFEALGLLRGTKGLVTATIDELRRARANQVSCCRDGILPFAPPLRLGRSAAWPGRRGGVERLNVLWTAAWTLRKRCADRADLNR